MEQCDYEVVFDGRTLNGRPLSGFMGRSAIAAIVENDGEDDAPSTVFKAQRRRNVKRRQRIKAERVSSRVCECGCGGLITARALARSGGRLMFVQGHGLGARCECGCGGRIPQTTTQRRGRPRTYLPGHNARGNYHVRVMPRCPVCYRRMAGCHGHGPSAAA